MFSVIPALRDRLSTLRALGLGYLTLGQSGTTLSGGEAQRLKLGKELARKSDTPTLYVLDEPTTGLHPSDVEALLEVLDQLVAQGHTVIVIEHAMELVARADHVIDLGPEGGAEGGPHRRRGPARRGREDQDAHGPRPRAPGVIAASSAAPRLG